MAAGFDDPRVKVHIGDGFEFLERYENEFDVIITDSSDPEGPAELLFQRPYFELLNKALKVGFSYLLQPIHELEGRAMANMRSLLFAGWWCHHHTRLFVSPSF